jgi:ABC-type Na+ efflux pump permease subunit
MILTILKKDIKLFFNDKKSVFLTFLMPIFLISLFAFAFGGTRTKSKPKQIKLLVTDNDLTEDSQSVLSKLDSINGLVLIRKEKIEAEELVRKGKYVGVLIFEKGFQDSIAKGNKLPMELKFDAAREIEMGMLQAVLIQNLMSSIGKKSVKTKIDKYLNTSFSGISTEVKEKIFEDMESGKGNMGSSMGSTMELKMTSIMKDASKKGNLGLIQAVAGTAIMMLLFSLAGIGGGLLDEKESGTLKRLLYSPLRPNDILFGKLGTSMLLAVSQLVVMFVFSWLAFGLPIFNDVSSLILMILCTAFAVSSFGILLVSIVKTRQQLNGFATIIIMLMSAIGGSMLPIYIMPEFMQKIAVISVNYWGIQGFYDIFWRNLPLVDILPKMGILIGIGFAMTLVSIKMFKKNLLKMV